MFGACQAGAQKDCERLPDSKKTHRAFRPEFPQQPTGSLGARLGNSLFASKNLPSQAPQQMASMAIFLRHPSACTGDRLPHGYQFVGLQQHRGGDMQSVHRTDAIPLGQVYP